MRDMNSPAVDVTIGGQTRIYHAYITTAPATLDGPATLTLYASTFADVIGWAAHPIPFDRALGGTPARLMLIGSLELAWQRARYREGQYLLAPTDPVLVGLKTFNTGSGTGSRARMLPRCTDARSEKAYAPFFGRHAGWPASRRACQEVTP
jgi:hypothetical protein